jgi:hypothetical protein
LRVPLGVEAPTECASGDPDTTASIRTIILTGIGVPWASNVGHMVNRLPI